MKFVVLLVALATQCVLVKSRNGYGYSNETLCVLEYITYLKRLSLIALMLGAVILYYVPKLRSHARKAGCLLIDLVANGLKFALNATETEYEYKEYQMRDDQNKTEPRIQELYRNACEEYITNSGQKCVEKCFDDSKWIENHERKRSRMKHNSQEKFKCYRQRTHQHNEDAVIKKQKSRTMMIQDFNELPQTATSKTEMDEVSSLPNVSSKTIITECNTLKDTQFHKLAEPRTNLQLKNCLKKVYTAKTNNVVKVKPSVHKKTILSMYPNINNLNDVKYELINGENHLNCDYSTDRNLPKILDYSERVNCVKNKDPQTRKQELNLRSIDVSNDLCYQRRIDKTQVENKKRNVKIPNSSQCQLENHYAIGIMNKQIADYLDGNSYLAYQEIGVSYDNLEKIDGIVTERELHDRLQRESSRFLNDMESMIDNCYEDILITKNRPKPTLLRVVNWFFGGCPEASRRIREQAEKKVGKEEIFKCTNAQLL